MILVILSKVRLSGKKSCESKKVAKMFVALFFLSFIISLVIIKIAKRTGKILDKDSSTKPQKMHFGDIPRGGGIGIFVAFCVGIALGVAFGKIEAKCLAIIIPLSFIFVSGILEDFSYALSPKMRLILQTSGVLSAIIIFPNCVLVDIGFALPYGFAVIFTLFCMVGVTNAMNIIDGFNGLAGGFGLLVLISIAVVSAIVGNEAVFYIALMAISAILGFLVLNFPNAKIFLGDGGAYLVGFLLAFLLVILTQDSLQYAVDSAKNAVDLAQSVANPNAKDLPNRFVSAYYGLCVMIYPVFEVLFSIWRRKKHKIQAMQADSLHLHTLIFKTLTHSNPKTTALLLLFNAPFIVVPIFCYDKSVVLIAFIALFVVLYLFAYKRIMRIFLRDL